MSENSEWSLLPEIRNEVKNESSGGRPINDILDDIARSRAEEASRNQNFGQEHERIAQKPLSAWKKIQKKTAFLLNGYRISDNGLQVVEYFSSYKQFKKQDFLFSLRPNFLVKRKIEGLKKQGWSFQNNEDSSSIITSQSRPLELRNHAVIEILSTLPDIDNWKDTLETLTQMGLRLTDVANSATQAQQLVDFLVLPEASTVLQTVQKYEWDADAWFAAASSGGVGNIELLTALAKNPVLLERFTVLENGGDIILNEVLKKKLSFRALDSLGERLQSPKKLELMRILLASRQVSSLNRLMENQRVIDDVVAEFFKSEDAGVLFDKILLLDSFGFPVLDLCGLQAECKALAISEDKAAANTLTAGLVSYLRDDKFVNTIFNAENEDLINFIKANPNQQSFFRQLNRFFSDSSFDLHDITTNFLQALSKSQDKESFVKLVMEIEGKIPGGLGTQRILTISNISNIQYSMNVPDFFSLVKEQLALANDYQFYDAVGIISTLSSSTTEEVASFLAFYKKSAQKLYLKKLFRTWRIFHNSDIDPNVYEELIDLYENLTQSAGFFAQNHEEVILGTVLNSEQPVETMGKILNISEIDIPDFLMRLLIFKMCFPKEEMRSFVQHQDSLSPLLSKIDKKSVFDFVIFSDVARVMISSRNQDFLDTMQLFSDGENKDFFQFEDEDWFDNNKKRVKKIILVLGAVGSYFGQVDDSDFLALTHISSFEDYSALKEKILFLYSQTSSFISILRKTLVNDQYTGFDLQPQFEERGRENAAFAGRVEGNKSALLETGDLLKAIDANYLNEMSEGGFFCPELLGLITPGERDSTPFDVDFVRLGEGMEDRELTTTNSFNKIVNKSDIAQYGSGVYLIVKNPAEKPQFSITRGSDEDSISVGKSLRTHELFQSGVIHDDHWGIRTGLGWGELNGFVITDTSLVEKMCYFIALKGLYIPVFDDDVNLLYTEEQFLKDARAIRSLSDIQVDLSDSNLRWNNMLLSFKENDTLASLYEADSGVSEGYSIEKHTKVVLQNFDRNLDKNILDSLSRMGVRPKALEYFLLLHDIGKPYSKKFHGNTDSQSVYSTHIFESMDHNLTEQERMVLSILVKKDVLGPYIKGLVSVEEVAHFFQTQSNNAEVEAIDLLELFVFYYTCDAGAYTSYAGAKPSLDHLFVQDGSSICLSPNQEEKIRLIREKLSPTPTPAPHP